MQAKLKTLVRKSKYVNLKVDDRGKSTKYKY